MNKKSERLLDILGQIDEDLIEDAAPKTKAKAQKPSPIKWLSIAACFVIVTVVGVVAWRSGVTDPSASVSPGENTTAISENSDNTTENDIFTDTPVSTDTEKTPDTTDSPIGGGEEGVCPIHEPLSGYVGIPFTLIQYVGEEDFYTWVDDMNTNYKNQRTDGCICTVSLPTFIEEFNVPNNILIDYYYNQSGYYTNDWDIESLLAHDWSTFDEYTSRYNEHQNDMEKRRTEWHVKDTLIELLEKNPDPKIQEFRNRVTDNGTKTKPGTWSFAEYVEVTGIDRNTLESIIASHAINSETGESIPIFEYNLDMLYNTQEHAFLLNNAENLYPVQLDALLHK